MIRFEKSSSCMYFGRKRISNERKFFQSTPTTTSRTACCGSTNIAMALWLMTCTLMICQKFDEQYGLRSSLADKCQQPPWFCMNNIVAIYRWNDGCCSSFNDYSEQIHLKYVRDVKGRKITHEELINSCFYQRIHMVKRHEIFCT